MAFPSEYLVTLVLKFKKASEFAFILVLKHT